MSRMKAVKISAVKFPSGEVVELGDAPAGFVTINGDMYTYDNIFRGNIPADKKVTFIDEAGVQGDPETVADLFCCNEDYVFIAEVR